MTNHKFQVGVIGLGARAEVFTTRLATGKHPRAELFGLCDIDPDRMKKYCDYCGHGPAVRRFTDPAEFLGQKGMDAVVITTPEFTHREVATAAMAAGKHIYLEKAMAATSADCREIIRAHRRSGVIGFLGFNLRPRTYFRRMKQIVDSGALGQILHVSGLEQLHRAHGASFMRRFHRYRSRSGGLLNTKCAHDLDILLWLIGHQHQVTRVASFGGANVFRPDNGPAGHGAFCHECPEPIYRECPYKDQAGFVFPVGGKLPIHKTQQLEVYGGDLCVYHADKDIVDNQTVIWEWDHGVRGNFNLQLFQAKGRRATEIWGELGLLQADTTTGTVRVTNSRTGEVTDELTKNAPGAHGGADTLMLDLFLDAIEKGEQPESGLEAGLAATLLAEKADDARLSGQVVEVRPEDYI